ncbi:MAG TPA: hypothetical protein VF132_05920 [Rudaea sp.]
MAIDKYLVVIGLSDEDTAHLRLIMRAAHEQLTHRWRWGTEDNADLVVVDPDVFAGQMARNRAFSSGRRCAIVSATETLRNGELHIAKPLTAENVTGVLNAACAANSDNTTIVQQKDDFYAMDSLASAGENLDDTDLASAPQRELTPAQGLDEFLKPDDSAYKPAFTVPLELHQDTTLEGRGRPSTRSERRVADSIAGLRKTGDGTGEINFGDPFATDPSGGAPSSLRAYLDGNLLGGPSVFTLDGAPPLILDPKTRHFHSTAANLPALSPYCTRNLPRRDWRALTSTELARVREEQPAQPYDRLIWLNVLLRSAGRLASHLDPGGRYRLKPTAQIERDVARHANIATAMHDFAKLNEISAHSGASMADVFAVVNAYDAIGALEVEPRRPRHAEPDRPGGLLSKLNPFKKS